MTDITVRVLVARLRIVIRINVFIVCVYSMKRLLCTFNSTCHIIGLRVLLLMCIYTPSYTPTYTSTYNYTNTYT